jgi:hypothetical protein
MATELQYSLAMEPLKYSSGRRTSGCCYEMGAKGLIVNLKFDEN